MRSFSIELSLCKTAAIIIGLTVDPGSNKSVAALFSRVPIVIFFLSFGSKLG